MFSTLKKYLLRSERTLNLAAKLYNIPTLWMVKGRGLNEIIYIGAFLKRSKIKVNGENNTVIISPGCQLENCLIHIVGDNCKIKIEKHCYLSKLELWIEDDGGAILIGYHTTIEGGHIAATEGQSISIGEDCMFSKKIEIRNGDSHSILDLDSKQRINPAKSVTIGNHIWLGAYAKVLKGSVIEDGCVIATGSIFTGHGDANSIYAGVPSKKVKENIVWDRKRK